MYVIDNGQNEKFRKFICVGQLLVAVYLIYNLPE
jgi:hypothetical protein